MKMKFEVNKQLVPMKAHYFLFNAGTGPIVPFLSVYARQLGFSSVVVGLIYTILPVSGMIAKPTFGAISDRFHCQKKIFLIAQLLTAVAFLAIYFSPKITMENHVEFNCNSSTAAVFLNTEGVNSEQLTLIQDKNSTFNCELTCPLTAEDLEVLCTDWKLSRFCGDATFELQNGVTFSTLVVLINEVLGKSAAGRYARDASSSDYMAFQIINVTQDESISNPSCPTANINSTCNVTCEDNDVNALFVTNEIADDIAYGSYQFWVFLALMITAWVGQAVTVSIGDAICFAMLGDKPNRYGYQRMFGALGWGLLSLIAGVLVDVMSEDKNQPNYSICFYLAAVILVLDFIVSSRLQYTQTKLSTNIFRDIGKLLLNVRILVFLLWCICVGMCTGLMWNFLLWLVQDLGQARGETRIQTLQGIIMGVQCLGGELPFFFLSGKILKKMGHISAMSLVLFALGVRFVLYSVIENPWYFIPIEFSNGLTFGLFYACMASYASIIAPLGTEATMQGLVGAVFEGVGVSLGSLLAGITLSKVSGSLAFRYFGFGALGACFVHISAQYLLRRKDSLPVVVRKPSLEKVRLDDQQELTSFDPLIPR
ncbi:major facilitator superfamily domain-containing protein 6 [Dendroctonus ponderosae]|uniref:major facilitator superfamily domain-containing protein 6 n=1 Tax=Dendroctonus ponderosae TaxID=77166 RepID=UPI00203515A4|nr:major facilitator superfamily domain-containing protein 6 [Dendroctonus ponderosae]KAH1008249.1 hypothetical protein HUJ05_008818 [Dendroctonus ponderosae]